MAAKKKPKKPRFWLVFCLCTVLGGALGYVFGPIVDTLPEIYTDLPLPLVFLCLGLAFLLTIVLHELAHLVAFKLQGMHVRAFMIGPFAFLRADGKTKLRWNWNSVLTLGGMVMPVIPEVNSEEDLQLAQKKYSRAILAAPYASLGIGLVFMLGLLIAVRLAAAPVFAFFALCMALFALLTTLSCLIKTPIAFGDFPAAKMFFQDRLFVALQLYAYLMFMEDHAARRANASYLKQVLLEELEKNAVDFAACQDNFIVINAVDTLLVEALANAEQEAPVVTAFCAYFAERPELLTEEDAAEPLRIFYVHLLYWLKRKNDAGLAALRPAALTLFKNKELRIYYDTQMEQILNGHDHRAYLTEPKNIKNSSAYSLYRIFAGAFEDERKLNQRVELTIE